MSAASAIPDATPVSVAAELLGDAKSKREGKLEEKPAWSDVQQVGKPTAETRCGKSALERAADTASAATAIDEITSGGDLSQGERYGRV